MLANLSNSNIHFGWNGVTHQALSQAATNAVNKKMTGNAADGIFNTMAITLASPLPDKEKHVPHSHSADIDSLQSGDAYDTFQQNDKKIKEEIKSGNSKNLEDLIGRNLHYLQDMTDPAHAMDYLTFIPTQKDKDIHLQIENDAKRIQKSAIVYAKQLPDNEDNDFDTFLTNKMSQTKEIYKDIKEVYSKRKNATNKVKLETLETKSLVNSYQVTYRYLKSLAEG